MIPCGSGLRLFSCTSFFVFLCLHVNLLFIFLSSPSIHPASFILVLSNLSETGIQSTRFYRAASPGRSLSISVDRLDRLDHRSSVPRSTVLRLLHRLSSQSVTRISRLPSGLFFDRIIQTTDRRPTAAPKVSGVGLSRRRHGLSQASGPVKPVRPTTLTDRQTY